MVYINDKSKELIKLHIKGFLMVAYGSGLSELTDYDINEQIEELYDSIEEVLDKQEVG
jgi:hypothetical protein